jgi:hypothetical protein
MTRNSMPSPDAVPIPLVMIDPWPAIRPSASLRSRSGEVSSDRLQPPPWHRRQGSRDALVRTHVASRLRDRAPTRQVPSAISPISVNRTAILELGHRMQFAAQRTHIASQGRQQHIRPLFDFGHTGSEAINSSGVRPCQLFSFSKRARWASKRTSARVIRWRRAADCACSDAGERGSPPTLSTVRMNATRARRARGARGRSRGGPRWQGSG